jgi:hypothetical protein
MPQQNDKDANIDSDVDRLCNRKYRALDIDGMNKITNKSQAKKKVGDNGNAVC